MMSHPRMSRGLLLAAVLAVGAAVPSRAADPSSLDCSLKFVPAEAAFYTATLRNREQFDAIATSNAWTRLKALPFVQTAWKEALTELNKQGGALEQFEAFRKDPENQQLLDLGLDMISSEFFCYGDESVNQVLDLYARVQGASRFGTLMAMAKGENRGMEYNDLQVFMTLKALQDNLDLVKVPDIVFGFRLKDTDRAEAQIKRLEALIKGPIGQNPMLKGRLRRVPLGDKTFLAFNLDGGMIPWDELPIKKYEKEEGEFDKLRKKLKSMTLTVSMGVRGPYMLVSIGASTKHLAKLGKAASLAGRPEFQPLAKYTDKRIIDIGYISKELRTRFAFTKKDLDEWAQLGREGLKNAEAIPEPIKKRLEKDLEEVVKDVRSSIPEVGANMSFTFMTPSGQEGFAYDWSEHPSVDGTKALSISQHLGGNPLLAVAGRAKYSPETYATTVKWLKKIHGYVDDFVVPQLDENQKALYAQVTQIVFPILKRIDNATGKMILPALADGQTALVLDAKWTSKKWFPEQPESEKPLPMLELGLVQGVSDVDKLKKGFGEYRAITNDILALVNQFYPQVPQITIPEPSTKKLTNGTMYFYPIPEVPNLDKRILPNAGLSDNLLALTFSEEMTERLLSKKPLKTECALLKDLDKTPLASMSYFDFAGLVNTATPWVEFAIEQAPELKKKGKEKDRDAVRKQTAVVLELLKVFRCAGTVSYVEGKAMVTHTETVLRDVK